MKAKLRIGESGQSMDCEVEIAGAKGHMGIKIHTSAERGSETKLTFEWPDALEFTGLICQKAAEMARIS